VSSSVIRAAEEPFDKMQLEAALLRWRMANEYLAALETEDLPAHYALRILVAQDFPLIIREIVRLRPELA
jgi:hypothetical protein